MNIFKKTTIFLILITTFLRPQYLNSQSTGLRFKGQEYLLNERTSLELFPNKRSKVTNHFSIEFDLAFQQDYNTFFGYIFRIITSDGVNIDLIYENTELLSLIIGESEPLLSIPVSTDYLGTWRKVKLDYDLQNSEYALSIGDFYSEGQGEKLARNNSMKVFFGANHHKEIETTDLPNMKIRDIIFSQNHKVTHHWPLNKVEGEICEDNIGNKNAIVENPYWLYQDHVKWKNEVSLNIGSFSFLTFNPDSNMFYIVSNDSLIIYNPDSKVNPSMVSFPQQLNLFKGQNIIYDSQTRQIIWYSIDRELVSEYDIKNNSWSRYFPPDQSLTDYWQHNYVLYPKDTTIKLFGGYGWHTYKNDIYNIDIKNGTIYKEVYDSTEVPPRYLSGIGANSSADTFYIIGGYGSIDGKQSIQPKYWYELLRYIPDEKQITKIHDYEQYNSGGFCFANSIIVKGDEFYALGFSKFEYDNYLQLYKGSLSKNTLEPLGEKIPFNFHDIQTFVDLYFSPSNGKLYATVIFQNDNSTSEVDIYSLNYPPKKPKETKDINNSKTLVLIIGLFAIIFIAGLSYIFIKRRRKNPIKHNISTSQPTSSQPPHAGNTADSTNSNMIFEKSGNEHQVNKTENKRTNQILLFGGFQIINEEGKDITGKFTPLLKELFLLLFLHSFGERKGISSEHLREILWSDKTVKDARNNRAVNISKLKTLLSKVGNINISKETGYWKMYIDFSKVYADYAYFYEVIHSENVTKNQIMKLIEITRNKPFLRNFSDEWLDKFKAEVSNCAVDKLIEWASKHQEVSEPASSIPLADAVFEFDPVNEEAVEIKCKALVKLGKHSLAKKTYDHFIEEYKILYDEAYPVSFHDMLN